MGSESSFAVDLSPSFCILRHIRLPQGVWLPYHLTSVVDEPVTVPAQWRAGQTQKRGKPTRRWGVTVLLLAASARAESAFVDGLTCGTLDSRGVFRATRAGIIFTQGYDAALDGTSVVSFRCQGYQGFPAGRRVVYDFATTGSTCGVPMLCRPVGPPGEHPLAGDDQCE